MPVEIGRLKSLQTLPKIVLSKGRSLGLKELREMTLLRGTLAIFELQNVMDIEDVKEACMRSKSELDYLRLTWGSNFDTSTDRLPEEDVIDLLQPHENLRNLKIDFYRGLTFPNWVGDRSYNKLSGISINNCLECTSLPPLGQLPNLKHLMIANLPKVKSIGQEWYGYGEGVPFLKLETLRFDHMPEWEEWAKGDDGVQQQLQLFPHLQELAMFKCCKLKTVSPLSFPSLQKLDLEECNNVLLESFSSLNCLAHLKLEAISGLLHLPKNLTRSLVALEALECCNCNDLVSVWEEDLTSEHVTRLNRLVLADCSQLASLGHGEHQFPCNLQVLELFRCVNLMFLPDDLSSVGSLREMIIKNCTKLINFPENGIPPMLKRLEILNCNALESLPSNTSGLERLEIKDCSSLREWTVDDFPVTLKKLAIKNCDHLEPVSQTMFKNNRSMLLEDLYLCNWPNFSSLVQGVHGFQHLVELNLSNCKSMKHFSDQGFPPSLRSLSIEECPSLKSLPGKIRTMKSLISLEIRTCPRLHNFPNFDLPPNLSSLRIWNSRKLKPLTQWGLHRLSSLREFSICGGFKDLELLGDDDCLFPPSLVRFSIARFPKLTSLAKVLENLKLLRHLSVINCENLHVLPSERLLEKLWQLEVSECNRLKGKCAKDKGEYWHKIAGIPCVEIDGTYVYKQS